MGKPPVISGHGQCSNYVLTQIVRDENTATVNDTGNVPIPIPNFLVLFHEAFGHFEYHNIQNSCTQNQQTIDYENNVRQLRAMPLRSGKDHPEDHDY
jgi:hypothetical protein